jgi:4-hydroxybenzoate polyprenyltransferase
LAQNYQTFPVVWGEKKTKKLITILIVCALMVIVLLQTFFSLHAMIYYFVSAFVLLLLLLTLLWRLSSSRHMGLLLQLTRLIILFGIISLPLLRLNV